MHETSPASSKKLNFFVCYPIFEAHTTKKSRVQYLKSKDHNVVPPNNSRCSCWIRMLIISKMTALKFWSDISKENLF